MIQTEIKRKVVECGNRTNQVPHKVVGEEHWQQDSCILHTIGQDYDHGHGLKFKCSLCNIFYMLLLQKAETYITYTDNILLIHLMIFD